MCQSDDERRLGRLGEKTLDFWASQVGITINKAQEDERGWDYILEFSNPSTRADFHFPLDKEPSLIICFVQVKSTDKGERSCSVKLSNWASLVKRPEPVFFLVLEFDHQDECQRAFLVHLDEEYIGKALKRLREAEPEKRDKLHEMWMDFSYGEAERLQTLNGQGLRAAIVQHVGESLEKYVAWKHKLIETVGYEDGGWQLNFQIEMPDREKDIQELLVDFALGRIPSLKVIRQTVWDVRFGIKADEPTEVLAEGILNMERKPVGAGTILLTLEDGSRQVRLDTEVYTPQGMLPIIDDQHRKVRFAAPFVDSVMWLPPIGKFQIGFSFPDLEESHDLKELRHVAHTVLLLHEAHLHGKALDVEPKFQGKTIARGRITDFTPPSDMAVRMAQAVSNAWEIAKSFDAQEEIRINLGGLLRQAERLEFLGLVLSPNHPAVNIGFWSANWSEAVAQTACIPMIVEVVLGQHRVAVALAMFGQPKATGEMGEDGREFIMDVTNIRVFRKHIWEVDQAEGFTHRELKEAVAREYGEDFAVILIED